MEIKRKSPEVILLLHQNEEVEMRKTLLSVARKLEKASKAHAGQAKKLKKVAKNGKKK
tara:strand:+ start:13891 stop:14064 length:174 start_codon:yes stop_codon:yes gene_type:complete